jgi:hypothetical protein
MLRILLSIIGYYLYIEILKCIKNSKKDQMINNMESLINIKLPAMKAVFKLVEHVQVL